TIFGFDGTDFLNNDRTRPARSLYLFHRVRLLLGGRRLVFWGDKLARQLAVAGVTEMVKDPLATRRALEGVLVDAPESASDALDSPIARTIVEQTPTKILFPNSDATRHDYIEGLGLSEREFQLIKNQIVPGSRMFLIKRGRHSVVCQLDLKGF